MNLNNRVSGGRNPNWEPTCGSCIRLLRPTDGRGDGGWCQHPENRTPPQSGWPRGFAPSVSSTGGCDLHTSPVFALDNYR
jgi:hypothetical protein